MRERSNLSSGNKLVPARRRSQRKGLSSVQEIGPPRLTAQGEANPTLFTSSGRSLATIATLIPRRCSSMAVDKPITEVQVQSVACLGQNKVEVGLWEVGTRIVYVSGTV